MSAETKLPAADYERRDASPTGLLLTAAGLAIGMAIAFGVARALYVSELPEAHTPAAFGRQTSFSHGAQAQTGIAADWVKQDAAVREHLQTYGWIDRRAGVVRIPIDRAIDLLVAEAPAQKNAAPTKSEATK